MDNLLSVLSEFLNFKPNQKIKRSSVASRPEMHIATGELTPEKS